MEITKEDYMAINVDNPNRTRLYNVYTDVEADPHLSGCVAQRKGFVMARSFKLSKQDGSPDNDAQKLFNTTWFKELMDYCLDANFWGHSLIELGDVIVRQQRYHEIRRRNAHSA
jgi:hypothetical protein